MLDTLRKKVYAALAAVGLAGAGFALTVNQNGCEFTPTTGTAVADAGPAEGEDLGEGEVVTAPTVDLSGQ